MVKKFVFAAEMPYLCPLKISISDQNTMLQDWLPTSAKEVKLRGWDELDVILFSGDAYVDHPSFGAAVIGRVLEAAGYRVAIVPQPDWHGDYRDFRKLGVPRLFFGVSPGAMDSMVNHYTANRRRRSDDAYTPDGRPGMRPDMPSIVYTKILRELYPDVPIVLGGIEASLRRLSYYDYWEDRLRPSLLAECDADVITYGMGEQVTVEIAEAITRSAARVKCREDVQCQADVQCKECVNLLGREAFVEAVKEIPQVVCRRPVSEVPKEPSPEQDVVLHPFVECLRNKRCQAENFRHIEEESNKWHAARIWQVTANVSGHEEREEVSGHEERCEIAIRVNPPYPPLTTEQVDRAFDLPYTRMPHPRYNGKRIPAYEMIRHSICMHRGCFGGCAFCTISAHQGKFIASRSKESILREARQVTQMPDFKGYISDLGGPSANMYGMRGKDLSLCEKCKKPSCLHPQVCPNLNADHSAVIDIYRAVDALPGVKKSFVGSGVRYDLILHEGKNGEFREGGLRYAEELIRNHVSGRLKVAPEHTNPEVLRVMRKPSFELFHRFKRIFDEVNRKYGLKQQLIPYFISSHPASTEIAMAELAAETKSLDFKLEQVQDFTPTPMTVSTEIWYSGLHPYTLEPCYCAHSQEEKLRQRAYFFWYQPENVPKLRASLIRLGRRDLAEQLFGMGGTKVAGQKSGSFNPNFRNSGPGPRGNQSQGKAKPNRYDRGSRSNPRGK